jgi:hypothetical protein
MREWKNGDKVTVCGREHIYIGPDWYTYGKPVENLHVVMSTATAEYYNVHIDNICPAPRSIEDIVQEAVEDTRGFCEHVCDKLLCHDRDCQANVVAALFEAAIEADREERA